MVSILLNELLEPAKDNGEVPLEELIPSIAKQGVAGLSDATYSGLPGFAGILGGAVEAGIATATRPGDQSFIDNFMKAISEEGGGITKRLLGVASKNREATNELVGGEAKTPAEKLTRLLTTFVIPFPASKAKSLLEKSMVFAAPLVRMGPKGNRLDKGFAVRSGVQGGVGIGIDQGTRAVQGAPLLFTDETGLGQETGDLLSQETPSINQPLDSFVFGGDVLLGGQSASDTLQGTGEVSMEELLSSSPSPEIPMGELLSGPFDPTLAAMDKAVQDQADSNTLRNLALMGSAAATLFGVNMWRQSIKLARQGPIPTGTARESLTSELKHAMDIVKAEPTISNKARVAELIAKDKLSEIGGRYFDRTELSARALRNIGAPKDKIDKLKGQARFDTHGQLVEFLLNGILDSGKSVAVPMRALKRQFDLFDDVRKQQFVDYTSALIQDASRTRATADDFIRQVNFDELSPQGQRAFMDIKGSFTRNGKEGYSGTLGELEAFMERYASIVESVRGTSQRVRPGLWKADKITKKKTFVEDPELRQRIEIGDKDPELVELRKNLGKINELLLEESVDRGVQSRAWADSVKAQFQRGDDLLYMPGKTAKVAEGFWRRQARNLGFVTTEGKNATRVANFYQQALKEGEGIGAYLDPFQSTTHYVGQIMEHNNRSVVQWNFLSTLTGLSFDDAGKLVINPPSIANRFIEQKPPSLIAVASPTDPTNQYGKLNISYITSEGDVTAKALQGKLVDNTRKNLNPNDPGVNQSTPEALDRLKDTIVVQRHGDFYIFGDLPRGMKTSLSFDPVVFNNFVKFMAATSKVMKSTTTGKYSPFAPISALYNMQMAGANFALRNAREFGVFKSSAQSYQVWKDAHVAAYDLFTTRAADEYAQLLTHALETNSGIAKMAPDWTKNMQGILAKKAKQSMNANALQRSAGRSRTGYNPSEVDGQMNDALEQAAFHINKGFGSNALPQFARIWDNLTQSMHESAAYAVTLRKLGGDAVKRTGDERRAARRFASDMVGDTRLKGSQTDAFVASVPFASPMLQGFSTMGRAMGKAGFWRTVGVLGTVVGMPTALEVTYNTSLDIGKKWKDAEGREWGYGEYYWKGYTATQRVHNRIIMLPWLPPWEALLIPFVPEFGIYRGAVIDAMEVVFGLSEMVEVEDYGANHLWHGLVRTFNISLPIPIKVAFSQLGVDVRAGPVVGEDGSSVDLYESRQLESASRATGNQTKSRYEGGQLSVRVQQMLSDILGAGGTLIGATTESFFSGNDDTPMGDRLTAAADTFGRGLARQAKIVQPVFGKLLRNTPDPDTAKYVRNAKNAFTDFKTEQKRSTSGGTMSGRIPALGRSYSITLDPIMQQLAIKVDDYEAQIDPHVQIIADLKNQINSIGNSLYLNIQIGDIPAGPISVKQRDEIIDAMNLTIGAQNSVIKAIVESLQDTFATDMEKVLGRDLSGFTFAGYAKRPNPSSTSLALPKSLPTSR